MAFNNTIVVSEFTDVTNFILSLVSQLDLISFH
jgi:hypothetical protein